MAFTSAVLILNCRSGCEDKRKIARLFRSLSAELGIDCDIVLAKTSGQLVRAARSAAAGTRPLVIAAGGDGTINTIASQVIGSNKCLGVVPLGTFNYFARELGIPTDPEQAFRSCFEGHAAPVTVGDVNGRIFLNNASVGLYPLTLSVREQTYRRWGRSRIGAYWSVLKTLLRRHSNLKLTITANGERKTVRTPLLFVARNSYQLEQFNVPGVRCVAQDAFNVYIMRPMDRMQLVRFAFRALARKLEPRSDFDMLCTNYLRVESRRIRRTVAYDGERIKMIAPLEFRIREHALSVVVPIVQREESAA
jgi:diacylglycerol kinase family enzyme